MGNVSRSIRQKQSSMGRQNQVVEKIYPLSIEPIEEETSSCASSPGINQKKLINYGDLKPVSSQGSLDKFDQNEEKDNNFQLIICT